jgi:hypothetical protein
MIIELSLNRFIMNQLKDDYLILLLISSAFLSFLFWFIEPFLFNNFSVIQWDVVDLKLQNVKKISKICLKKWFF